MREKLAACVTFQDSHEVFTSMDCLDLNRFIKALTDAKEFIDLTMRDNFLLNQAESIYTSRGYRILKDLPA
jgi:hypothetical protein